MPQAFVSKRAPIYTEVPDEKWNDWRWQLSNRLNSVDDIQKVVTLTESERKALNSSGLFRVDITPYFISLIDPDDLLTVQQASGLAVRDEKTIRRWLRDFEISIVLGGTLFIRKSKLLAHLAHTKRSVD